MSETKGGRPGNSQELDMLSMSLLDDDIDGTSLTPRKIRRYKYLKYIRIVILFLFWLTFTTIFMMTKEMRIGWKGTVIPATEDGKDYLLPDQPKQSNKMYATLFLHGPFKYKLTDIVSDDTHTHNSVDVNERDENSPFVLIVDVRRKFNDKNDKEQTEKVSDEWYVALVEPTFFDTTEFLHRYKVMDLKPSSEGGTFYYHFMQKGVDKPIPLKLISYPIATKTQISVLLSGLLILAMHLLLFWDGLSRAIVGILFCTFSISLLGIYAVRPPLQDIVKYVDIDVMLLIIGLTIIVGVLTETAGDKYVAVQAFRLSNGHIWPMLTIMCLIAAFGAAFLDNITIMILITSIAIRLCEIIQLNPTTVLTCLMIFSNIGYILTPNGIPQNQALSQKGIKDHSYKYIKYGSYMLQMIIPVILAMVQSYIFLRFFYGSSQAMRSIESPIAARLRHAIRFWSHTAETVSVYTKEEIAVQQKLRSKVDRLRKRLKRLGKMPIPPEDFKETLRRLEDKHRIKNKVLLIMCGIVITLVVLLQVAYSVQLHNLSPGWICLLLALILLALADWKEFESLMAIIDWSTLILIACLFIITRILKPLGLIDTIGNAAMSMVNAVDPYYRLNIAVIIILAITTFSSAFLDSSYVCYVMTSRVLDLAHNPDAPLALEPMLLAVLLGTCFGVNTTIISTSSNVVVAGLAEKHGYKFYFWDFFKVGFVITLANLFMSMIYLLMFNLVFNYK